MINAPQILKGLQTQVRKAESEIEVLKIEIASKQKEMEFKRGVISGLKKEMKKLESDGKVKVTEHAMLRYLERVKGIDMEEVQKEIVTNDILDMVKVLGGKGEYPNKDFMVVMKDYVVVSIVK